MPVNTASSVKFTLLTACKNEERDIRLALESALAQTYPHKEIIFVDDSTDGTKEIIRSYSKFGVILIDGLGEGCCRARNLGMERATGDVVVFLTADTRLEPDYLEKILPYYQKGYDWVTVESCSFNTESVYSRFVEMQHRHEDSSPGFDPLTTQGYSVRRDAALAVGGITGGIYPVNFCRDWSLGKKMTEKGCKKMHDRSIVVPHKSPDTFSEYWTVRKARGLMSVYQSYFLFGKTLRVLFFRFMAKDVLALARHVLVVPIALRAARIAWHSNRPFRDFPLFLYAGFMQSLAFYSGEWQGYINILRLKKSGCHGAPQSGGTEVVRVI